MPEERLLDYTILNDSYHKQDLKKAKQKWRNQLFMQGFTKRGYKYKTILKFW